MSIEQSIRKIVKEELEQHNKYGRYQVELTSKLLSHPKSTSYMSLPFPPFIGLVLNVSGAKLKITEIYWNDSTGVFEVKADDKR